MCVDSWKLCIGYKFELYVMWLLTDLTECECLFIYYCQLQRSQVTHIRKTSKMVGKKIESILLSFLSVFGFENLLVVSIHISKRTISFSFIFHGINILHSDTRSNIKSNFKFKIEAMKEDKNHRIWIVLVYLFNIQIHLCGPKNPPIYECFLCHSMKLNKIPKKVSSYNPGKEVWVMHE